MTRLRNPKVHQRVYWRLRERFGMPARHGPELLHRLRQREQLPLNGSNAFLFPWGKVEFVDPIQLRAQYEEIFIDRQYAFSADTKTPTIIDCGGNIGLSAIWFQQNYPGCRLTVYEPDPDLSRILHGNLDRAGFSETEICQKAVWIDDGVVSFQKTGDDKGRIASAGSASLPAVDLAAHLPDRVDLLKLDIEGAEYRVLEKLCETRTLEKVRRLICELHVWRESTGDLLQTLGRLHESGMRFALNAAIVPYIGVAAEEAPFEAVKRDQVLMELYAWRS